MVADWLNASIRLVSQALESKAMPSFPTQDLATNVSIAPVTPVASVTQKGWPKWIFLTLLILLIGSPASTKVAGAAWFLIVFLGLWAALRRPVLSPLNHPVVHSSLLWFATCLFALVLQCIATYYWADPWGDRHVEVRLLLGATATFALLRHLCLTSRQKNWLTHSLALACWVALGVSYIYGRETPSNAIPWAAGISFFVCVLMPLSVQSKITSWQSVGWFVSALAGVVAILLSQSRGSYGIVLWVILFSGIFISTNFLKQCKKPNNLQLNPIFNLLRIVAVVGFLSMVLLSFPRIYQEPLTRVQAALHELKMLSAPSVPFSDGINTSVGARIHMWRAAVTEIAAAPLLGHGSNARIAWIHQLGAVDGSDTIKNVDHLHSDFLTTLFDHGFLGLFSYMSFGISLAWIALRLRSINKTLSWSLLGLLWMHLTAGLTNMNFGHNYYGVMLALSLLIAWIQSMDELIYKFDCMR